VGEKATCLGGGRRNRGYRSQWKKASFGTGNLILQVCGHRVDYTGKIDEELALEEVRAYTRKSRVRGKKLSLHGTPHTEQAVKECNKKKQKEISEEGIGGKGQKGTPIAYRKSLIVLGNPLR